MVFLSFLQTTHAGWADGTAHGAWFSQFDGYGTTRVVKDSVLGQSLQLRPETSIAPAQTHAALATTQAQFGDFDADVRVRTLAQLRRGGRPNPWEMGWVLWHYENPEHFYYVVLKPNGWEIGKEDPAYAGAQRFLASGNGHYAVGKAYAIHIRQQGNAFTVLVDGKTLARVTDAERPYAGGAIGLYAEDAQARFSRVAVSSLP